MAKINLPVDGANIYPNINNLTGEAKKYQELQMKFPRTNSGQETFTAYPSGITYKTEDYSSNTNIYNKGEDGMMNLLYNKYAGTSGWIFTASDFNIVATTITDNLTTTTTGTALDAHQGYVLNQSKLGVTATAANSSALGGLGVSSFQKKILSYSSITVATSAWKADSTYNYFPYAATVYPSGFYCSANDVPIIFFDPNLGGAVKFCSVSKCVANGFTIYCNTSLTNAIVIPTILIVVA